MPVQVPAPLVHSAHRLGSPLTDLICEIAAEAINPETDAFVTNIYTTFVKQVLYVSKGKRKSDIHQHAKLDDLGRGLEVPERVLGHFSRLTALPGRLKPSSADIALRPSEQLSPSSQAYSCALRCPQDKGKQKN